MANNDDALVEWQCPPAATSNDRRLSWLNTASEEGMAWLKSQRGATDWKKAIDIVAGKPGLTSPEYRSQVNTNHLKRNIREIVGTLAKIRPMWGYNTDNRSFKDQAELHNKVTRAWYLESFADRSIKEALQYAAATCSGWIRPIYRRSMAGTGHGEIKLLSYGAPCVLPLQLPPSGDFQQAYAVTILDEMPIYMAHAMFPLFQEQLRPTSSLYWYNSEIRKSARGNLWKRMFAFGRAESARGGGMSDLLIPVRYTYVIDLTVNKTGKMIPMGEPGTSWFYTVPAVGMPMPGGKVANESDARLYPYRRLLISSESCIMYDGPSFDWHGMVPLAQFTLDRWAWEPLGFSIVRDGYDIQLAITELERGVVDKLRAQNDMALAYDINSVTSKEAKQFDPMQPRARIGWDASSGAAKPFEPVVPPEVLKIFAEMFTGLDHFKNAMDEQHAIKDVMALAKARLAGDDLEKIMEANGPIVSDMSRDMEQPMRAIGDMVKYLILQYMTTSRIMQYVGVDGITPQTFDFNPDSLVPSHMPGENPSAPSGYTQFQRARIFADNLRFFITPNSLHEMEQMAYKLGLIQLQKTGVMVSSETVAEAWGIPNYGTFSGNTQMEKWVSEQEMKLQLAARAQALMSAYQMAQEAGVPLVPPLPPGSSAPGKNSEGRPPTGQEAPALKQKANGRATITESEGGGRTV